MANEDKVPGGACTLTLVSPQYGTLVLSDNMPEAGFHIMTNPDYNRTTPHDTAPAARKIRKRGMPVVRIGISVPECRDEIIGLIFSEAAQPVSGGISYTESLANKILPDLGDLTAHPVEAGASTLQDFKLKNVRCVPENLDWVWNNNDGVMFYDSELIFEGVVEAGEALFEWGVSADVTAPTVSTSSPLDGASGVAVDATVTVTFDDDMMETDVTDIDKIYIVSALDGVLVGSQSITYSSGTKTITIAHANFASTTDYLIVINPVRDTDGNYLAAHVFIDFTTT